MRPRSSLPAGLCLLALACASAPRADVVQLVAEVDGERLEADVRALAALGPRPVRDEVATEATLDHLEARLTELGLEVSREPFLAEVPLLQRLEQENAVLVVRRQRTLANLIATRRGVSRPWEVIELGAHYDSVPLSPGADDDASGVAALLEVARLLQAVPLERTVRLCLFAAEEEGLLGSRHHAAQVAQRSDERLLGAIVLDMVGYASHEPGSQATPVRIPLLFDLPRAGDFVLVVGNFHSGGIGARWEQAAARYAPELGWYSVNRLAAFAPDSRRADQASYWAQGLRAVLLTDTAELRNPTYHQRGDIPDTLDFTFLADVTRALAATVIEWAGPAAPQR
jgi:aminopeptidase YwaD